MASNTSDAVKSALGQAVREALKNVGDVPTPSKRSKGPLSGARGLAAGAGLAALAPLTKKGVDALRGNGGPPGLATKAVSKVGDRIGSSVKSVAGDKIDEAGGAGGLAKQAIGGLMPGGGDDDDSGSGGMPGVGKGRRMPIQQSVDVAVPLEMAYNQWTQFEDWPEFMHRVTRVSMEDPETVSFATKIWGKTKEFKADIITQRPDDRVKWRVTEGLTHSGVVSFHELAPRLTRIELDLDVEPGSLIEKAARGMRHIKRAVRADLHRYKAFVEMQEHETGAWRGRIEDGEVVEDHDPAYDSKHEYSDPEDIMKLLHPDSDEEDSDEETNGTSKQRTGRFQRQASASRSSGSSRSTSTRKKPSSTRSSSSKSTSSKPTSRKPRSTSKASSSSSTRSRSTPAKKSSSGSSGSSGRSRSTSAKKSSSGSSGSSGGSRSTSAKKSSSGGSGSSKSSGSSTRRKTTAGRS